MLADDQAVESILFRESNADPSPGLIHELPPGAIHISMSTISVAFSQRLKQAHESAGQVYIAAPVFGRPEAAAAGKLSIVAAGPADAIEKSRPLFEALGQNLFILGEEQPQANLVKLTGNFMIASMLETLGEAYALVGKAGIEPARLLEIVNGALFKSPIYQNYGTIIAEQKFEPPGFKLRLGLKDVRLALAAADASEVPMPFASIVHDNFLSEVARGRGDADWAALGRVAAERAGLDKKR
jgi:3-hydroxyisobutyrate dehydrogenase-like beta-hydroxyacid dehydrogenase